MRSDDAGGCDFAVDPILDLPDARIFWQPQEDTSVVVLTSMPTVFIDDTSSASSMPEILAQPDESKAPTLVELGNGERLQVVISGSGSLTAVVPLGLDGFGRIESLYRYLAAVHGRAIPPDTRLTAQQKARSRQMLQAFDGWRDGAGHREIARVLFKIGRLGRDEWQASSARHRVMSYLRGAQTLIAGGYRRLLRHDRRRHRKSE